ncbi:polyamine ABC transporter substrate-binding protein [Pannonibacter sp. Q-1]|uniref:Putrescine-binding periplasmic protein n=1 Tax=Pannonibacter phragmitetus TaxID=121719 RepID=A0A0L0J472_9HYPH|nr:MULTISPECIES: polyamine ABC transporter substrate-binding protein [Pannonibacter]ALV29798.1 spermidine/putrescine ABC transporter substrate-binding protein [Pannonibacter phragmitetus]KND20279.1 spermidine/putrescine ABC transporter substrate-binding protein [Pannonibacter phragmitetus]MBA4205284.1 spermidine/putrescine ABC transporter substrate-binding protein PotF [Polymorphum sp.]
MLKAILSGVAAAALVAGSAAAQQRVVNVYNWSDYIDESILADFTQETGIRVVYDVFDSNETLETKLLAGGTGYDIVVPTGTFLGRQIQAGVFQKLDKSKLPNLVHMWPEISERLTKYDPGNEYAINYMWGTTGIGYNVDKIKERMPDAPTGSWEMVFKPEVISKFADCGIFMLDTPEEMIPAALNYLGLNPDSDSAEDIEKAGELLATIKPYITKFHSSEYINALANGDACMAIGWSGDILQARDRAAEANNGVTVEYSIPKEGALMWFDNMAIPSDAKNVAEAHEFLNYIMRPEVIAKASNYVFYANGNKDSKPLLNKDVYEDTAIYPDEETIQKLYTVSTKNAQISRIQNRVWTKVKSGR